MSIESTAEKIHPFLEVPNRGDLVDALLSPLREGLSPWLPEYVLEPKSDNLILEAIQNAEPNLLHTPYLAMATVREARVQGKNLRYVAQSLAEDATVRLSSSGLSPDLGYVTRQLARISALQEHLGCSTEPSNQISHFQREIDEIKSNKRYLEIITKLTGVDAEVLHKMVWGTWGTLTSSEVVQYPDMNYRHFANNIPGVPHTLRAPVSRSSNCLTNAATKDLDPFTEATAAAQDATYCTSPFRSVFGFEQLIRPDHTGKVIVEEHPLYFYDATIEDASPEMRQVLTNFDEFFPRNHDLLHHLVQVWAPHFMVHHRDAPISFGNYMPSYLDFGKRMRRNKEAYELGVTMAHAKIMSEYTREETDQMFAFASATLEKLSQINMYLPERRLAEFRNFYSRLIVSRVLNVFAPNDPRYRGIEDVLSSIGVEPLTAKPTDIVSVLRSQRLLEMSDEEIISLSGSNRNDVHEAISHLDNGKCNQVISSLKIDREQRELGSEFVVKAIEDLGLLTGNSLNEGSLTLSGLSACRWFAIMMPQRMSQRGFTEKVHGLRHIPFGSEEIEPLELIKRVHEIILLDSDEYQARVLIREEVDKICNGLGKFLPIIKFESGISVSNLNSLEFIENQVIRSTILRLIDQAVASLADPQVPCVSDTDLEMAMSLLEECKTDPDLRQWIERYKFVSKFLYN